jgi:poly(rC)-binding protein 2/3/4
MSTSPAPKTKRPLEDTSSPSRTDQPDAKRPALDKVLRNEGEVKEEPIKNSLGNGLPPIPTTTLPAAPDSNGTTTKTNGEKADSKDDQGDTVVPDAESKPINSTTAGSTTAAASNADSHDETTWIHIRAVISSPEAATIIGKGGENVSKIRQLSSAKCTVSDYQKGAVERILTVSGIVDAVAKVIEGSIHATSLLITFGQKANICFTPGLWSYYPHAQQ